MDKTTKNKRQEGASAVEFALILPMLILLLFGIIEFSILFYDQAMITNASREGARAGIVYTDPNPISDAEIQAVVNNYSSNHLITFGPDSTVNTTITRTVEPFGNALTVNVSYQYEFLVLPNIISGLFGASSNGGLNLTAESVMRMENQGGV